MSDRPGEPDRDDPPGERESSTRDEVEEVKRQDSDAPAIGAVEDGDEVDDLPEPHEPG